jgi:hypothetical protein
VVAPTATVAEIAAPVALMVNAAVVPLNVTPVAFIYANESEREHHAQTKNAGYPPPQESTQCVEIVGGKIEGKTVAWGDWVFWVNKDVAKYTPVVFEVSANVVPPTVWATPTQFCLPGVSERSLRLHIWDSGFSKR